MAERPILFSLPMVRAILAGEKTQTRRPVKPQPPTGCTYAINGAQSAAVCAAVLPSGEPVFVPPTGRSKDYLLPCPLGAPGDTLWVRETWRADDFDDARTLYAADMPDDALDECQGHVRWRPSIHMPRGRARIVLRVTSMRVERLHAVTDADALAEGVKHYDPEHLWRVPEPPFTPREVFNHLWARVYGGASWAANPWVWVVGFERGEVRP